MATSFISIRGKTISCPDYGAFDDYYVQTRALQQQQRVTSIEHSLAAASSINIKKQLKGRLQAARRHQSILWPKGKKLRLSGIKCKDDNGIEIKVSDPVAVQSELRNYWGMCMP